VCAFVRACEYVCSMSAFVCVCARVNMCERVCVLMYLCGYDCMCVRAFAVCARTCLCACVSLWMSEFD